MTANIYDTANQLEKELRETDAFRTLVQAIETVNSEEHSRETFAAFREVTLAFQEAQMTGQEPSEELLEKAKSVSERAHSDDRINALMQAEQQLSVLMNDINRIITKPLQELYNEA